MSPVVLSIQILDEVEKRHQISTAIIYPFMQGLREAAFPAPGKTVTLKSFIPDSGTEVGEQNGGDPPWVEEVGQDSWVGGWGSEGTERERDLFPAL